MTIVGALKNINIIALREIKSFITSPMMYIVVAVFFLIANLLFISSLEAFDEICKTFGAEVNGFKLSALDINSHVLTRQIINLAFICIFFLPILSMRLLSDEKKNRTIELLMTSPVSSFEIIMGKFLGMNAIWIGILILTLMYPFAVKHLPLIQIDWSYYMGAFFGLYLFGLFGLSIGLFASALTDNGLISAVIGFFLMGTLYFLINVAVISDSPIGNFAYAMSSYPHIETFAKGIIDTKDVLYFLLGTGFILFVSERVLESQRWR